MSPKEILDIVALVQNNPLTKLHGHDYHSKIITKLKEKFKDTDQQLFVANFYCFLNYDTRKDFVINLDRVWKWMGYSRIDPCKVVLIKNFIENQDYKIEKISKIYFPEISGEKKVEADKDHEEKKSENKTETRGRQGEFITFTIQCFKKLCLKSKTKKADEIHDYYIGLEEILNETMAEESEKLLQQLAYKDKLLQDKDKLLQAKVHENEELITKKEKTFLANFSKKPIVYIGLAEPNIAKFGYTGDLETRIRDHKREIKKNFTFEYVFECKLNRELEKQLKEHEVLSQKRISKEYNGKNQTELFLLDAEFTIKHLYDIILQIKDELESDIVEDLKVENTKLKQKISARHDKKFIARHIETGEEIIFKSYADAHDIAKIGPHSIRDNYLNQAVQCRGWTFRHEGEPWWDPPQPFIFNPEQKASTHMIPCKSTHIKTGKINYYNSIIEAAQYMYDLDPENFPLTDSNRRTLLRIINDQKPTTKLPIKNYKWESCAENSYTGHFGYWVWKDGTREEI